MGGERGTKDGTRGPSEALARRFLRGDAEAVSRVQGMAARVVRYRGYFIPPVDRADIVQEVLAQVWQAVSKPGFVVGLSFDAMIRSVACRRCVDWMRRARATTPLDPAMADRNASPDREYQMRERLELGRAVLKELRGPCRELIRLFVAEERSYREIAALQRRSEGALRTQMSECLREAREIRDRLLGGSPAKWQGRIPR